MEELNSSNVLEFWKNATLEQQRKNIDRALELTNSDTVVEMWKTTKKELKRENTDLIIRIIKEKFANGKMYTSGLWKSTPIDVQMITIEEVFQLFTSKLMIEKIWKETHECVKEQNKGVLAKALKYDEKLLKKYDIPEYIPAPPGMLEKKDIDDIIWGLMQLKSYEISTHNLEEAKIMMTKEMPITSIPYFFKQIAEKISENYVMLFWNSLEENVQYNVIEDVIRQISSKELGMSIWNQFTSEIQKEKIKELVRNGENVLKAGYLIKITGKQTCKELLEEMIAENAKNVDGIWKVIPTEVQLEYFSSIMEITDDEEIRAYIWQESTEEVQRNNFKNMLQTMNNDVDQIIDMLQVTKLPRVEIIEYILQEYEGKELEQIIGRYRIDLASLEELRGKISPELTIKLVIRNASELSIEKLEKITENFNITSIEMLDRNNNLDSHQQEPYDVDTYKKCRSTIDELLEGIDLNQNLEDPNREKIIFAEVIKRLANHICYDYESFQKIEKNEPVSSDCANMVGGLLKNTCVCSGYAEIVRNVFSCCGIEVRYISGDNIEPDEHGHAWNQIKLDGTWYNMDLTWDRDRIVAEESPWYLLKSDWDFAGHTKYVTKYCKKEKCSETVSDVDMKWYLYKKLEIPKPIDTSVRRTRRRRVERAYNRIAETQALSAECPEKR